MFVYFILMSLIVLYFLRSTLVLSFYNDVVLTLSIKPHIEHRRGNNGFKDAYLPAWV